MIQIGLVPITKEVLVEPSLINELSALAFPNPLEFAIIVDTVMDEAFDEVYSSKLSDEENKKRVCVRYYQKIWNLILEKGRDDNV